MADGGAEQQHPYKRFRSDYGQSDEEWQSQLLQVDDHRSPQQQIYLPESRTPYSLRFPENHVDESYLVLEEDVTVKSKPCGATAMRHPSDVSGTDTTTDDSSNDAGITMGSQPRPRRRSSKRSRTPDDGTGDDDTGSEASVVVKSSAGEL